MKKLKSKSQEEIQKEVFEDEDFKRMIIETSEKEGLPIDVVETVIKNFIEQLQGLVFNHRITISAFGYFNLYKTYKKKKRTIKKNN